MATNLSHFVGQFIAPGSGTTLSVTAPGFQPTVVIFFSSDGSPGVDASIATFCLGFSDGTNHRSVSWAGNGNAPITQARTGTSDTDCIQFINASGVAQRASVVMTATGFDVTWNVAPGSSDNVAYIALAGTDLANVAIGTDTMPLATGNKSVTGLGFQPNFVMLLSGSQTTAQTTGVIDATFGYGCALSSSARFAHAAAVADGQTMSGTVNGVSIQLSTACLVGLTNGAAVDYQADFVSMDAGGFTINFSNVSASAFQFYYLAIGGTNLHWDINTATRPTTATAQSRTGLSFKPDVVWWSNSDLPTLNSITSNAVSLFGATDGTHTDSIYASHNDAINTVAGTNTGTSAAQDGVPASSSVVASFTSLNADGWTITWGGVGASNQISSVSLAGTTLANVFDEDFPVVGKYQGAEPGITVWQSPQSDLQSISCQ